MTLTMIFLLLPCLQEDDYSRLSNACALERPDAMMRQGRYLEAAVGYRNLLMRSDGRDEIRIPLAFALLGTGDVDYAGKQIRCAQLLFEGFDQFRFDPASLFSSTSKWKDLLHRADARALTPDGWLFLGYARFLSGDKPGAQAALTRYTRWRGGDETALGMDLLFRGAITSKQEPGSGLRPKETLTSKPKPVPKQEPKAPLTSKPEPFPEPGIVSPGKPRSAGGTYLRSPMEQKKDQHVDR